MVWLLAGCVPKLAPAGGETDLHANDSAVNADSTGESGTDSAVDSAIPEDMDGDGHTSVATGGDDCDDTNAAVYPGAPETCDGVDNNCSGDENDAADANTSYPDADGDHYGDANTEDRWCYTEPAGDRATNTDCDDHDAAVNPAATEICADRVDENCDPTDCRGSGDWAPSFTVTGDTASANDGVWAVAIGDLVGGDGLPEIVLGQPEIYDGNSASVAIYQGPFTGDRVSPSWVMTASYPEDGNFGMYLTADGDYDHDGEPDLIVAAEGRNEDAGVVYIFREGSSEGDDAADVTLLGENAGDLFGADNDANHDNGDGMTMACDFDGDGNDEVVVGAAGWQGGDGRVYIFAGPSGTIGAAAADALIDGDSGKRSGHAVACLDGDHDGHDDLAIGAPADSAGGDGAGGVYLIHGPITGERFLSDSDAEYTGHPGEGAGAAVHAAGDLTGDGWDDIVTGTITGGRVYVTPGTEFSTTQPLDNQGSWLSGSKLSGVGLAGPGDVDGDGAPDLLVGYSGAEALVYGPLAVGGNDIESGARWVTGTTGNTVGAVGDVNGDGWDDFVSSTGEGSDVVSVYLGTGN